ncbi:ferric-chelate reductase Frp1 [Naganishia albida]|nr:ferric-chelate reductase Frp1 [Naganishia albida]
MSSTIASGASRTGGRGASTATAIASAVISSAMSMASGAGHGGASPNSTSSGGHGSSSSAQKSAKAKAKEFMQNAMKDMWWLILAVIGLLTLVRVIQMTREYYQRNKRLQALVDNGGKFPENVPKKAGVAQLPAATITTWQTIGHLTKLPTWLSGLTVNEIIWTSLYIAMTFFVAFYGEMASIKRWGKTTGLVVYAQFPLIFGLVGKNNVIHFLTGIPYEKLNYLHRMAGRTSLIFSWVHTIAMIKAGFRGGFFAANAREAYLQWGWVAVGAVTILTLHSFRPIRNMFYEMFYYGHIVMAALYLAGCWLHWDREKKWIIAGIAVWAFDRVARLVRVFVLNRLWVFPSRRVAQGLSPTTVDVLDQDTVRVTCYRPDLKWKAGQHAYLMMPSISTLPFEAHPFTFQGTPITEGPDAGRATLLIRVRDGFTKRLLAKAHDSSKTNAYLEGPYGGSVDLRHNDSVVVVVGGSGVTYGLACLYSVLDAARVQKSAVRKFNFVWMLRSREHYHWIKEDLEKHLVGAPAYMDIAFNFHITQYSPHEGTLLEKVATLTRIATHTNNGESSSEGYNSSSPAESINEKERDADEKFRLDEGKEGLVHWHQGRANLSQVIDETVGQAQGSVSVNVCGPSTLQNAVRKAVATASSPTKVYNGQAAIEFHCENFGW